MTTHGLASLNGARHTLQKLSIDPYSYKSHLQISPRTPDSDEVPLTGGNNYHHHNHNNSYSSYEQAIVSDSDIDDMGESIHHPRAVPHGRYSDQEPDEEQLPAPILCSVLCQHDFDSSDPDHLPFRKNEVLDVIKQEDSGWWAAMRVESDLNTGMRRDVVGWIPEAYVKTLPPGEAERLRAMRPEFRGYDYAAEELWRQAPVQSSPSLWDSTHQRYDSSPGLPGTPLPVYSARSDPRLTRAVSQMHLSRPQQNSVFKSRQRRHDKPDRVSGHAGSTGSSGHPTSAHLSSQPTKRGEYPLSHAVSSSLSDIERPPSRSRAETIPNFHHQHRGNGSSGSLRIPGANLTNNYGSTEAMTKPPTKSRVSSSHSLTRQDGSSSGSEAVMHQKRPTRTNSNRVPGSGVRAAGGKPRYVDEIILDSEGRVRIGNLDALVEKLVTDCSNNERKIEMAEETTFRRVFLTTFRTFMTAEKLFEILFGIFYSRNTDDPDDEVAQRQQLESRRGVLTILLIWIEDYRFLEEDVLLAGRLREFLDLVKPPLESLARKINRKVDKITFQINNEPSPVTSPVKTRKFIKMPRMDSSKLDSSEVADQLTILEFAKYRKITHQECLRHTTHPKEAWPNLNAFCGTHEKIVHWVKCSILEIETSKQRGDMIEHWIKVADRCKTLGNFATMSAVVTSLSSTVISQLALSWNRVSLHRRPQYDSLLRLIDPTGNFSILRGLLRSHDGPSLPFVLPYLTDLAHINDTYSDEPSEGQNQGQVCFVKRQKWFDVVQTMLRYQSRPYDTLVKVDTTMEFVERHLKEFDESGKERDEKFYWNRSRELQAHELQQHDLLKGTDAAGSDGKLRRDGAKATLNIHGALEFSESEGVDDLLRSPAEANGYVAQVQLRLSVQRLRTLQQKKEAQAKAARREIATLVEKGKIETARIKAESLIHEDIHIELLELLELYCELLLARFGLLDQKYVSMMNCNWQQHVDERSAREPDPELFILRDILTHKYGREFTIDVMENKDTCVSDRVVRKLNLETPSPELVDGYLTEITRAYGVEWRAHARDLDANGEQTQSSDAPDTSAESSKAPVTPLDGSEAAPPRYDSSAKSTTESAPEKHTSNSGDPKASGMAKPSSPPPKKLTGEDDFDALAKRFAALKKR